MLVEYLYFLWKLWNFRLLNVLLWRGCRTTLVVVMWTTALVPRVSRASARLTCYFIRNAAITRFFTVHSTFLQCTCGFCNALYLIICYFVNVSRSEIPLIFYILEPYLLHIRFSCNFPLLEIIFWAAFCIYNYNSHIFLRFQRGVYIEVCWSETKSACTLLFVGFLL